MNKAYTVALIATVAATFVAHFLIGRAPAEAEGSTLTRQPVSSRCVRIKMESADSNSMEPARCWASCYVREHEDVPGYNTEMLPVPCEWEAVRAYTTMTQQSTTP